MSFVASLWDPLSALLAAQSDRLTASLAEPSQVLALAAAAVAAVMVVVSAFVKTMIPLRWLAVISNAGFIVYGIVFPAPLILLLHLVLLPVNLWRLVQMVQLTRRVSASHVDAAQLQVWLRPYMRSRRHRAGSVLFRRGDRASRLYFLVDGRIALEEAGRELEPGEMFGEIAFFVPDRQRSSTARCLSDCTVMSIDEDTFRQLVYQNPDFGVHVIGLIAARLSQDVRRARAGLAAPPPSPPQGQDPVPGTPPN
ncbi:MAG: cyclic nucleotide-binding domain-containing protein [Rubrivivax sp.]|nr:cyclic nucleotide-binding domain-containing protein [Rubrivivax sp.]